MSRTLPAGPDEEVRGLRVLAGPDAPEDLLELAWPQWQEGQLVAVSRGYDARWERQVLETARERGTTLLSVRAMSAEILVGPLWHPDGTSGCAGCAHIRDTDRSASGQIPVLSRPVDGRPDEADVRAPTAPRKGSAILSPALRQLVTELLHGEQPLLASGELLSLTRRGELGRHKVLPSFRCSLCGGGPRLRLGKQAEPPRPRVLAPRPTTASLPDRGQPPFGLDPDRMRAALADARFGPVISMHRFGRAGMAMAQTDLLGAQFAGHGRATTFRHAEAVGCLEAYERSGGYPYFAPIVPDATARQLGDLALDVSRLGHYTARQLASPLSLLRPFDDDTPMDWVWGHRLDTGQPLLVPAEVGFYQYRYPVVSDAPEHARRIHFIAESSSGSALGGSYEEATLHSLFELAERDAFLLSWHRRQALPRIAADTITDQECRLLIHQIEGHGYDLHLLVATADLKVPVVWAMAVAHDGRMPTCLNSAGSGADPVSAAKAALWEMSQLVSFGLDWDVDTLRPAVADPWLVDELLDHHRRYAYPELLPQLTPLLGGPEVSLAEAFPGWPQDFTAAARGDVTEALRFVAGLFRDADLEQIVVVEQSTPEHTAAGLSAVKAVVPGILPMCFGQAQQRLAGLPRLAAALTEVHGVPPRDEDFPFDPHPFP